MATEVEFDKMAAALDRVVAGLNKVDRSLQETGKQVVSFQTLFASSRGLDSLLEKLKALSEVDGQKFSRIGFGINQMAEALVRLSNVQTTGNGAGFTQFAAQVQTLVSAFSASAGAAASIKATADALNALKAISSIDLSGIVIPPELGDNLRRLLGALSLIPDNDPSKKVSTVKKLFDGISSFFFGQFKAPAQAGVESAAKSIEGIARALKIFEGLSLDQGKINNTIKTVAKLGLAFQGIGLLLKILPGGSEIENFSKTIQRLGIGLSGIVRATQGIDFNTIKKFVAAITIIGGVTRVLSAILKFQDTKGVDAFANAISAVARVLQAVSQIDRIGTKSANTLNQIIPLIGKIVASFSKLRGIQVPDLGGVVDGIAKIIVALTAPEVTGDRLDQIPEVIDAIANSLKKLNGVRASSPAPSSGPATGLATPGLTPEGAARAFRDALLEVEVLKQIDDAFRFITKSVTNFEHAAFEAFKNVGQQAEQFGQTLISKAKQITDSFSLQNLQESGGFQIAQEFERTSSLLTAAGLNKDQLKLAQDFADTIGIQYPLSANQALDSILALTKAGQDLSNVQFILPSAADLAALTDTGDLNLVTQTLIGVAGAFSQFSDDVQGGFENISTAANLISSAADVSTASVESLSAGLANVGPSANSAGLDLQDTVAILSEFEDANIRGAEAGTALRSVLNSLQAPKARDELRRLGVETVNEDGTLRDLNSVIQDINAAYQRLGLTEAQQQQSIAQLGDSFARQGLNVLLLRNGYQDTITAMEGTDTAAEKAAQSMNNLAGDTEQLRGSVETLLKDVLLPLIGRVFRPLTQFALGAVNALLALPDPIKDIATSIIQLVATFGSLTAVILTVAGALTVLGGGFLNIIGSIGLLILRLPLLIAQFAVVGASLLVALPLIAAVGLAVVGLGTSIAEIYESIEQNIEGAGDAFNKFKESVTDTFAEVSRIFTTAQAVFNDFFGNFLSSGVLARGRTVASFFERLSSVFNTIRDTLAAIQRSDIEAFFRRISPFVRGLLNSFDQLGAGIFDLLTGNFDQGLQTIQRGFSDVLSIATDAVQRITGLHLGDAVAAFNEGDLQRGLGNLFRALTRTIQNLIRQFAPQIRAAFDVLLHVINPLNGVTTLLRILGLEDAANIVAGIADRINQILGDAFSVALRLIGGENIRDIFGGPVGDALGGLLTAIQRFANPIINFFERLFGIFTGQAAEFGQSFGNQTDNIAAALQTITGFVNTAGDALRRFLGPITDDLPNIVAMVEEFASSFIASFEPLLPFISYTFEQIQNIFGAAVDFLSGRGDIAEVGKQVTAAFIDVLNNLPVAVGRILINLGNVFHSTLLSELGQAFRRGDIVGGIIKALFDIANTVFHAIPDIFAGLGTALGLQFLNDIGAALRQGDILGAVIIGLQTASETIQGIFNTLADFISGGIDELANRAGPIVGFFVRVVGSIFTESLRISGLIKTQFIDALSGVLQIIHAILSPMGLLVTAISAAGIAFQFFGTQIRTFVLTTIYDLEDAIFGFIEAAGGIGAVISKIITKAGQIAGVLALIIEIGEALHHIGEVLGGNENVFQGFLRFLTDAAADFLRFTHLDGIFTGIVDIIGQVFGVQLPRTFDELIASVQNTANQVGTIFQYAFDVVIRAIGTAIQNLLDQSQIALQDLFHRAEEAAGTATNATRQFFEVGDTIAQSANISATQFFTTLGDALANPQDVTTLNAQLRQGANAIGQQFADLISSGTSVADLAAQGLLDDVAQTLAAGGQIPQALNALSDDVEGAFQLFDALNPEEQAGLFNDFFFSVRDGASATADGVNELLNTIDQMVASGQLTQEQADIYRNQLVPSTREAQAALDHYNASQQAAQDEIQATQDAATSYTYTLDGLAESFRDTSLSAEELGTRFRDVVAGLTSEEIDLGSLFDIYNQLSPEEAAASFGNFFEAAIRGGVARAGNEQYFQQLQEQIDHLRDSGLISGEERRTFLDQLASDAQTASTALDDTIDRANQLQHVLAGTKLHINTPTLRTPPTKGGMDTTPVVPPYDPNAGVDQYIDDATNDINKKISDFAYEEAKRIKKDLEDEREKAAAIKKIENDTIKDELKKEEEYAIESQRRAEDHQRALQKIEDDAGDAIEEAVANRDSAAAQAAQKKKEKDLKSQQDQYDIETTRRQEDEDRRRAEAEVERQEKIAAAQQDLQDLINKHTEERLEREADFQRELQETKDKNATMAAEQTAAYTQQVATNAALVNNTKVTTNQVASAVTAMLNSIRNNAQQQAGSVSKSNKAAANLFGNLNFSGLEQSPVYSDIGYGKSSSPFKKPSSSSTNPITSSGGFGGISSSGGFGGQANPFARKGSVSLPRFDTSGSVLREGLAYMDPGDTVLNRADSQRYLSGNTDNSSITVSPQITVNATPGMDVNALAEQIERRVVSGATEAIRNSRRNR